MKPKTDCEALIKRFPHLKRIIDLWGTRAGRDLLTTLSLDTRDGTRQGFPPEHATTLFRLLMEHDMLFPEFEPKDVGGWTNGADGAGIVRHERQRNR